MSKKKILLGVAGVLALIWSLWALAGEIAQRPHFERTSLVITRADGVSFQFTPEVAKGVKEQAYGLMFIHSMPVSSGMIFPYNPAQVVAFWMKNTYIPLDMLFVGPQGTLSRIIVNAKPEDQTPLSSVEPVVAVIEVNGGLAQKEGLAVGDKVVSPAILSTPR